MDKLTNIVLIKVAKQVESQANVVKSVNCSRMWYEADFFPW